MAKGDKVAVLLDAGNGVAVEKIYGASVSGRTIEFSREERKNLIIIEEKMHTGKTTRTIELRADRVILIEERPVGAK